MTFFDTIKKNFKDVEVTADGKINTAQFLEAAESLVTLFDLLGSSAFSIVQSDMTGNIKKVRAKLLQSPAAAEYLQDIVLSEAGGKKRDATQGLLWLNRGLQFTAVAMRNSVTNQSQELSESFTDSYSKTLTKHHTMLIRPVFKVAMRACPYRKDFYAKLGQTADNKAELEQQLDAWLTALEKIVQIILDFFASGKYDKGL